MSDGKKKTQQFALIPKVVNGGIAGIVGISCVFPLDLVKTRLQNQPIGPNGEKQYSSMFDCFKQTYKTEGYFGMYRGSAVNIFLIAPEKGLKLASNDFFRHHLKKTDGSLPFIRQVAAGGLAGFLSITVTTPMELLKIQMQDSGRAAAAAKAAGKEYISVSTIQLTTGLLKEYGIFGLYKGIGATALREISFFIIYFPFFAALNALGPRKDNSNEAVFWCSFLSGLVAGSISAFLVTPFDVVKTRLQASANVYSGIIDCAHQTLKNEGPFAFFKGAACRMMVIAPLYGIAQTFYYLGVAESLLGYERN